MNRKLEPGMLCLIVGCVKIPDNIGKSVTLIQYLHADEEFFYGGELHKSKNDSWLVEGEDLSVAIWRNEHVIDILTHQRHCPIQSKHLLPIPPRALIEDNEEEAKKNDSLPHCN